MKNQYIAGLFKLFIYIIDRALANRLALLDVLVTTDAVSGDAKSGLAWVPDLQPLTTWEDAERKWRQGDSKTN